MSALRDCIFDPVVADVRVSHHHDLKSVRRIGGDFLISGERGVEDDFADRVFGGPECLSLVNASIFEDEARGGHLERLYGQNPASRCSPNVCLSVLTISPTVQSLRTQWTICGITF